MERLTCCIAVTRAARLPWFGRGAEWSTNGSLVFVAVVSLWGVATSTVFESVAMTGDRVRPEEGRDWCKVSRWQTSQWRLEAEFILLGRDAVAELVGCEYVRACHDECPWE